MLIVTALGLVAFGVGAGPADATQSHQVAIRASGDTGSEEMVLHINAERVASWTVSHGWDTYTYEVTTPIEVTTVEVLFVNDNGVRDLNVDYVNVGGSILHSEDRDTTSTGTYVAGEGCLERRSSSESLHCNGSFQYAVPANTTLEPLARGPIVAVRARGTSGTEQVQVHINGVVVLTRTVSVEWDTYATHLHDETDVTSAEVHFVNDAPGRDLLVDYLEIDDRQFQSEESRTKTAGSWNNGSCAERVSTSEWLHCTGWFRYDVASSEVQNRLSSTPTTPPAQPGTTTTAPPVSPIMSEATAPSETAIRALEPAADHSPQASPPERPSTTARYSIAQIIDGTIGAGDGTNPNEEWPMGRHDAPLYLPQGWSWSQGPSRNSVWGELGTGGSRFVEWRCAVIPEKGHRPSVPFRINVRNGGYYQFVAESWHKGFDVDLTGGNHGGYLGRAGQMNSDPFGSGSHGQIQWRREADGSYSAPWNSNALMMHFWAGQRKAPIQGQTAEFLTSEVRLQQPDGTVVDLSQVRVLFQCGIDYYGTTGAQGTKVPGPGIAKYHRVVPEWTPGLWVTLPRDAPANSVGDFERWLRENPPPDIA